MGNQVHFYTLEEAVEAGIPYQEQSEFACEYCAKPLEQLGILGCDGVVRWVIRKECSCEGARMHREATKRQEELIERKEQESRFLRAGIAKRYLCASVSNSESVRYIESFRVGIGAGLYFVGGVGSGKTYEASAIAKSFIWAGYSVVFTTTLSMFDAIRKSYDSKGDAGIAKFVGADLLILDDMGKESANSWALTTLFQVLNARYDNLLPTVFTSQYPISALERRMSRGGERESAQAIASRISQISKVVDLGNGDRRRGG